METGSEMEKIGNQALIEIDQAENEYEALKSLTDDLFNKTKQFDEGNSARFTILMPAGGAAEKFFEIFQDNSEGMDFSKTHFIQAEQLWPIPKDHPASLLGGMEKALINSGVPKENIHLFNSEATNEQEATSEVEGALNYGIDYAIVGLNSSGAIAGLRDGEEFKTKHFGMVDIDIKKPDLYSREDLGMTDLPYKSLKELVEKMFEKYWPDDIASRPSRMFGPGWEHLLKAKELAILATGVSKKEAVNVAISNVGVDVPVKKVSGENLDIVISKPRDITDKSRHLTSTGEIALSRQKNNFKTRIYTDYNLT